MAAWYKRLLQDLFGTVPSPRTVVTDTTAWPAAQHTVKPKHPQASTPAKSSTHGVMGLSGVYPVLPTGTKPLVNTTTEASAGGDRTAATAGRARGLSPQLRQAIVGATTTLPHGRQGQAKIAAAAPSLDAASRWPELSTGSGKVIKRRAPSSAKVPEGDNHFPLLGP